MKTILPIIFLLCFTFSSMAQNNYQNTKEELIGTWTFDYSKSVINMSNESKQYYDKLKQNSVRLKRMEAVYKNRKISFLENGAYFQVLADGRKTNATWNLKNNELFLIDNKGKGTSYKIILLNPDELIIKIPDRTKIGKPLFTNYYYKKEQ